MPVIRETGSRMRRLGVFLLAVATVLGVVPPAAAAGSPAGADAPAAAASRVVEGSWLVTTSSPVAAARVEAALRLDLAAAGGDADVAGRVLRVRAAAPPALLRRLPGVVAIEPDVRRPLQRVPDDPAYPEQWAHRATGAPAAWDRTVGDATVRVAVIDTGVNGEHPDLAPNLREPQLAVTDAGVVAVGTGVDNDPCRYGHGTSVAGIVGAVGGNGRDVAGVAWDVSIIDIRVGDGAGSCDGAIADSQVVAAIDHAVNGPGGPVDVINLSLGGPSNSCPTALAAVLDDARAAGVLVVAAAGNTPDPQPQIPASCNGVVSVGASAIDGERASYSTFNRHVDVVAPGGDDLQGEDGLIVALSRDVPLRSTTLVAGTSFAAPYVAGVAALLLAVRPDLGPDGLESILERTAEDLGRSGRDDDHGWGLVRADRAVTAADQGSFAGAPEADPGFPVGDGGTVTGPPDVPAEVFRIDAGTEVTAAIPQAVAVSGEVYDDDGAAHVVLARDDDFADALAGSALGWGIGPLLFTRSRGPLADLTRREIERVLEPGATVYLLGGTAALPASLEDELRGLGFVPRRLAGASREETAARIASEVTRLQLRTLDSVLLARRDDWPDAVTGGSIAALFGTPILLTSSTSLHPATAASLRELRPSTVYALGGRAAITDGTLAAAIREARASTGVRLGGATRVETAVEIATELERLLAAVYDVRPAFVLAVNLRRADGFAHVLSASPISGLTGAVFVPVEGSGGTELPPVAQDYVRGFGIGGVLIGSTDVVAPAVGERLGELLRE